LKPLGGRRSLKPGSKAAGKIEEFVMPGRSRPKDGVASARLCPGIHVFAELKQEKTWMAGASPVMTKVGHVEESLQTLNAFSVRLLDTI
jgi:hypothetical protein